MFRHIIFLNFKLSLNLSKNFFCYPVACFVVGDPNDRFTLQYVTVVRGTYGHHAQPKMRVLLLIEVADSVRHWPLMGVCWPGAVGWLVFCTFDPNTHLMVKYSGQMWRQ